MTLYTLNQLETMALNHGDNSPRFRSCFQPAPPTFTVQVPRNLDNRGVTIGFRLIHSGLYEMKGRS